MKRLTTKFSVICTLIGTALSIQILDPKNVHQQMDDDELRNVFPLRPSGTIPEYEVVSLQWPRLHKRDSNSGTRIKLDAFGKNVEVWLHPTDGVLAAYDTPVYLAKSSNAGTRFDRVADAMNVVGKMLQDTEKRATLIVKRSVDDRYEISGFVGSQNWTVKPLPDRFNVPVNFLHTKNSSDSSAYGNSDSSLHVIYKSPKSPHDETNVTKLALAIEEPILKNRTSRLRRATPPSIIYPQILVLVDYDTYKLHGENVYRLLEYLLPFWNGVDLKYRDLESPKVRLNIAGIVVATDAKALPYMTKNKVRTNVLNILGALEDSSTYLPTVEKTFPVSSYDVAVTISPFDMCSPQNSRNCPVGTLGIAYLSGACEFITRGTRRMMGVAVIQDKGAFDGVHTAAHELGHLLGASHDGQGETSCSGRTGYIMASTPVLTENTNDWSSCSLAAFDKFLHSNGATCLFNKPKTSVPLERVLPGRLMTLDQQCQKLEGTKWCSVSKNPCMQLQCIWSKNRNYCKESGDAAADGSTCGPKKICIHGKCLNDVEITG